MTWKYFRSQLRPQPQIYYIIESFVKFKSTRRFPVLRTIQRNFEKKYPNLILKKMGVALPRPSG